MEIIVSGYMYPNVNPTVLEKTLPNLTFLSLFTYGITLEGELVPMDDQILINEAKKNGVLPLMVLTSLNKEGNFDNTVAHSVLNNSGVSNLLIENILKTIREKGFAGIDFDFEFLLPEDRIVYADFVNRTRERLAPKDLIVTVALAPKTYAEQPGLLYESHDYKLLGESANLTMLMTYEWGYAYGPPMAVAPINQVRKVLDFAVTQIPRHKILMGIPNYGYDWTLPFVRGESVAEKVSNTEALLRAEKVGAVIMFDELAQAPFYNYFDKEGRQHQVWYENESSIRAKLNLIGEYGIAGVSYWNLMDYFPTNWDVLNSLYKTTKLDGVKTLL